MRKVAWILAAAAAFVTAGLQVAKAGYGIAEGCGSAAGDLAVDLESATTGGQTGEGESRSADQGADCRQTTGLPEATATLLLGTVMAGMIGGARRHGHDVEVGADTNGLVDRTRAEVPEPPADRS